MPTPISESPWPPRNNAMLSREPDGSSLAPNLPPVARAQIATVQQLIAMANTATAAGLDDLADAYSEMADAAIKLHSAYLDPNGPHQKRMREQGFIDADGKEVRH